MAHKGHQVIADEGRAKIKAETRPRPTLGALPVSCRLHAQHPGRLAPRRTAHKVNIVPCSGMPPHTPLLFSSLLIDPPACTPIRHAQGAILGLLGAPAWTRGVPPAPERPCVV